MQISQSIYDYATRQFGDVDKLEILDSEALEGGHVARQVRLYKIRAALLDGGERQFSIVRKSTWHNEIRAMSALRLVSEAATALPEMIDHGNDEDEEWLLTPFYAGSQSEKTSIPDEVFESLAYVHSRYHDLPRELMGIANIDSFFWRRICLKVSLQAVEERILTHPVPVLFRARRELVMLADDKRIHTALGILPQTLLHGDMHNGNILVSSSGAKIIDWGNARVGPAMLDLANIVKRDSTQYASYARTWEHLTGSKLDQTLSTIGYLWATVQINIQYLGFAVNYLTSEDVNAMLDKAQTAVQELGAALT